MPKLASFFLSVVLTAVLATTCSADVIVGLNAAGAKTVAGGTAGDMLTINFFIGQDLGSNDSLFAIVADYDFQAGVVLAGRGGQTGAGAPADFYGGGNLSTSGFTVLSPNGINVNQEFTDGAQSLANSTPLVKWFEVDLDTTGLAVGTYTINLRVPTESFLDSGANFVIANNDLTFTISSVPEPASASILLLTGMMLLSRRRK